MARSFPSDSQAACGRARIPLRDVSFHRSERTGDVWTWGIRRCGSVWSCPVCTRHIARGRGTELQRAIDAHLEAGGGVQLVTATVPHHAGHRLREVLEVVLESWRYLTSGAPWARIAERIGYVGQVKGVDATHGPNGWHPHIHALIFTSRPLSETARTGLQDWLRDRWARKVEAWWLDGRGGGRELRCRSLVGGLPAGHVAAFGRPHPDHGLRVSRAEKAGWYVSKMGLGKEATAMAIKAGRDGHRTPWQILVDYHLWRGEHGQGAQRDRALWLEWCRTMQGRRALVWSPGLRAELEVADSEQTDQELAEGAPQEEDVRLVTIHHDLWDQLAGAHAADELADGLGWMLRGAGPEVLQPSLEALLETTGCDPGRLAYSPEERLYHLRPPRLEATADQVLSEVERGRRFPGAPWS